MKASTKLAVLILFSICTLFVTVYWFPWEKPETVSDTKGLNTSDREQIDIVTKAFEKIIAKKNEDRTSFFNKIIQEYHKYTRSPLWSEPRSVLNQKTVMTSLPNGQVRTEFVPSYDPLVRAWSRYWIELSIYIGIIVFFVVINYVVRRLIFSRRASTQTK